MFRKNSSSGGNETEIISNSDADIQTCLYLKYRSEDQNYEQDYEDENDVFNQTFEVESSLSDKKSEQQ